MGDVLWQHKTWHQVVDWSRLPTVRSQHKHMEASPPESNKYKKTTLSIMCLNEQMWGSCILVNWLIPSQVVEHNHVGIGVVEVVGVGWVVFLCPVDWKRTIEIENVVLGFRLIVHAVETHHLTSHTQQKQGKQSLSVWVVNHRDSLHFLWREMLTWSRKRCSSGWLRGLMVTSNRGMKIFSNISWKLASCFFVWYTSLVRWWSNSDICRYYLLL